MANYTAQVPTATGLGQNIPLLPGANFAKSIRRLPAGTILKVTIPNQGTGVATNIDVTIDLKLYPVEET